MIQNYKDFSAEAQNAIDSIRKRFQIIWDQKTLIPMYDKDEDLHEGYRIKQFGTTDDRDYKSVFSLCKEISQYEFFINTDEALRIACYVRDKNYFLPLIDESEKDKYKNVRFWDEC